MIKGDITDEELITFTFHSTAIEGSTLTYEEVYALLNDKVAANKPMEHNQMNIDHADAYRYALNRFKKDKGPDMAFIQSVCAGVMKNTGKKYNTVLGSWDESKGGIRLGPVHVGSRYFPNHKKVPGLMNELIDNYNQKATGLKTKRDILDLSFDVQYNLVSIHPFSDGNGRTARILTNTVLYLHEMPRMILQAGKKPGYYRALEEAREKSDINIFRDFMYENYTGQLQAEIKANKQAKRGGGMYMAF